MLIKEARDRKAGEYFLGRKNLVFQPGMSMFSWTILI